MVRASSGTYLDVYVTEVETNRKRGSNSEMTKGGPCVTLFQQPENPTKRVAGDGRTSRLRLTWRRRPKMP